MSEEFFIGDLHLGHKKALSFDNRPFSSLVEQDERIISNWNYVVSPEDKVYILGDVALKLSEALKVLPQLEGYKCLIVGNHDENFLSSREFTSCFDEITHYKILPIADNRKLILSHYPIVTFQNHYYGWYHFYSHVHDSREYEIIKRARLDSIKTTGYQCNMYNVGCMMPYIYFTPRTFEYIVENAKLD